MLYFVGTSNLNLAQRIKFKKKDDTLALALLGLWDTGQSVLEARKFLAHIHSFSSLSYDRFKASSKSSSPHSAI